MDQAIYYVDKDHADDSRIPNQAVTIPTTPTLDKHALLTGLASACHFPSYFSHNWDSAWDCLTDSAVTDLQLDLTEVEQINTEDFNVFKSIIEDAYRDFGKPQLWIVVASQIDP